jgi:hypothetical protein
VDDRRPGEAALTTVTMRRRRGPIAVAAVLISFVGLAVLVKDVAPGPALPTPTPGPHAAVGVASFAPTALPTASPGASPPTDPPSRDPTVTPHPTLAFVPTPAGKTDLVPAGLTAARLTVTLPVDWQQASASLFVKPDGTEPVGLSIGAYSVAHVNTFPCRWATGAYTDTAYPRTAEGQALSLSAFWGQDPNSTPFFSNSTIAPIATKPVQATIGDAPAWALQILIPSVLDFTNCDAGQVVLWETADGGVRLGRGPGEIDRLWVMDAAGGPIVIDAALPLLASPSQEAQLQAVVDSISVGP